MEDNIPQSIVNDLVNAVLDAQGVVASKKASKFLEKEFAKILSATTPKNLANKTATPVEHQRPTRAQKGEIFIPHPDRKTQKGGAVMTEAISNRLDNMRKDRKKKLKKIKKTG